MFQYHILLDMYIIDLFFYSFFLFFSIPNYMGRSYRLNSEKTFSTGTFWTKDHHQKNTPKRTHLKNTQEFKHGTLVVYAVHAAWSEL